MFKFGHQGVTQLGMGRMFRGWDLLGRSKAIGATP